MPAPVFSLQSSAREFLFPFDGAHSRFSFFRAGTSGRICVGKVCSTPSCKRLFPKLGVDVSVRGREIGLHPSDHRMLGAEKMEIHGRRDGWIVQLELKNDCMHACMN